MKDQVDGLRAAASPAAQLDSSQSSDERALCLRDATSATGRVRLLFVSPERLVA